MRLQFNLPKDWKFSESFPALPRFPQDKIGSTADQTRNFLDTLVLVNPAFILQNYDSLSGEPQPFVRGLNFTAGLKPKGLMGLFGGFLVGDPVYHLFGSIHLPDIGQVMTPIPPLKYAWQISPTPPGIHLRVDLGGNHRLADSKLTFSSLTYHIYCPANQALQKLNPTYKSITAVSGILTILSGSLTVELTAAVVPDLSRVSLAGLVNGQLANLGQLADAAGGNDLFKQLPPDVQAAGEALGGISLQAIGVTFQGSLNPSAIMLSVAMPNINTGIAEYFSINKLTADFFIGHPFAGDGSREISVTLSGKLNAFGVAFDVTVELPDLTINAVLTETATLELEHLFAVLGLPAPPDLTVDSGELYIAPGKGYSLIYS